MNLQVLSNNIALTVILFSRLTEHKINFLISNDEPRSKVDELWSWVRRRRLEPLGKAQQQCVAEGAEQSYYLHKRTIDL